ncbi:LptM family lipoprotein [Burkholderia cenocepacia]|uniref:LptM family lipoprotein n=1 Tax=Burkholderia cenocepacia TaxID=95486 RepID=UPI000D0C150A|nr:hypothetical protein [Burkholderia cenocepacia]SOT40447.1 exported hypothetical protein [Burkholderia cenocepacia]
MKNTIHFTVAMLAVTALAGCGEKGKDGASNQPQATAPTQASIAPAPTQNGIVRRSSQGQTYDTVLDVTKQYHEGDETYSLWRDLYWSKAKKDYQALAEDYSYEYNKNSNTFEKQDLLKTLTPKLDGFYDSAQKIKNVAIKTGFNANVGAYQPNKGFTVSTSFNDVYVIQKFSNLGYGSGAYRIVLISPNLKEGISQGNEFVFNPDEQVARKLEGYLASHRKNSNESVLMRIQVNGYVLSSKTANTGNGPDRYTFIAPDSLTLLDEKGEPVATIESDAMDKTVPIRNDFTRMGTEDSTLRDMFNEIKQEHGIKDAPKKPSVYLS